MGKIKKNRGVQEAYKLNSQTQNFYRQKITLLALNCFKWEGLPNNIPERFIETQLFYEGKLAFYEDPIVGLVCTKCNSSGMINAYDEPLSYNLYASDGYNKLVKTSELAILRNNKLEIPTSQFANYYIKKFFELDRTIDVNVLQQKTSKIIPCEESQRLTIENMFMQYEGNVPIIYAHKAFNTDSIKPIDLSSDYVADKLQILKDELWRECLDTLGIKSANTEKKERLIVSEVESNDQLVELAGDIFLEARQSLCHEVNDRFGTEMWVERRAENNGSLYRGTGNTSGSEL